MENLEKGLYWIDGIFIYSLLQIPSWIHNYVQSREYPYPSWQQVHMMMRVGREIRKIILPPSDNGILEKQWSFRAPCWWVNYKEETTGSNTPFCLCGCINYAIYLTGSTQTQTMIVKNTSYRETTYSNRFVVSCYSKWFKSSCYKFL